MVLQEIVTNAVSAISHILQWLQDNPHFDIIREHKILAVTTAVIGFGLIRWLWRPRNLPPGPLGYPIVGSLYELSNTTHFDYMRMKEKYGDIFCYYVGPNLHVVLNSDDLIREALVKRGDEFSDRPVEDIGGITDEIFSCKFSDNFKHVKKVSMQALKSHVLDSRKLEEAARLNAGLVIERLVKQKGAPYDIADTLVKAGSNVIYNLVFNDSFDFDDPRLENFIRLSAEYNAATFSEEIAWTFYVKYILPKFISDLVFKKANKVQDQRVTYFIQIAADQYKEHMKTLDPNNLRDYVDSILLARSDSEIWDMAKSTAVFIPDATHSIADVTRCCIYHLCKYPEEQKKMHKLLDDVCGQKPPTLKERGQLSYIEAFIWEVMRFVRFSPVLQPHAPLQDTKLAGYNIPKGCYVWFHVFPVYRDPKIFPEPEKFKPSRFLDQTGKLVNTALSYPMGMGRRTCMGKELFKAEVFILLSTLVQNMNFKFADESKVEPVHFIGPFLATTPRYELIATER